MIVPMNIHTGAVGPVVIAPADDSWMHSIFFGLAWHANAVVVTGTGCQTECGGVQHIEVSRYTPMGVRTWHQTEAPSDGAYGSDVVVDSQDRAIIAGASKQGGVLRGQAFARTIGIVEQLPLWTHSFPASKEASEALGAARGQTESRLPRWLRHRWRISAVVASADQPLIVGGCSWRRLRRSALRPG